MPDSRAGLVEVPELARAAPSHLLVFGIAATASFMGAVDLTIVATALPAIHRGLHASLNWVGWTITIYGLTTVIALPIAGNLSSQFGRRRVFLCGVSLFSVASLLCGFSPDVYLLIVFRTVQAVGLGALQPSATGLVADHFGRGRDKAIGLFGAVSSAGQVVGPIAGGILVVYLSWRWIFYVNVPIGIVLVLLTLKFIPESPLGTRPKTDIAGLALMAAFILGVMLGITNLGSGHTAIDDPSVLVPGLLGIALAYSFLRHIRRAAEPFVPVKLLVGRGFAAMNAINLFQGMVTFGVFALVPLYAEERYRLHALSAATLLTARAIGLITVAPAAALALRRTGYRMPMAIGYSIAALGTLLLSASPRWGLSPFFWLSASAGITGLGLGAVFPAANNACLGLAPDRVAAITGLRGMFINLGVIFSVSASTAILSRSADPGNAQAHIFWVAAGMMVLVLLPLVTRVPEHKGGW
jgi:EmrB/QacA subfamily drug resistance transporter